MTEKSGTEKWGHGGSWFPNFLLSCCSLGMIHVSCRGPGSPTNGRGQSPVFNYRRPFPPRRTTHRNGRGKQEVRQPGSNALSYFFASLRLCVMPSSFTGRLLSHYDEVLIWFPAATPDSAACPNLPRFR